MTISNFERKKDILKNKKKFKETFKMLLNIYNVLFLLSISIMNIVLFSNVFLKSMNGLNFFMLGGNFIILMIFLHSYFNLFK